MFAFSKNARAEARRSHVRTLIELPANLYLAADDLSQTCTLLDLSAGGAQIRCEEPPPLSAFVILHIEGFGRFEAVTAWYREEKLGLRFSITETRRKRLASQIKAFMESGTEAAALCGLSARG